MQKAQIVRVTKHNTIIQLLCTNGLELLSVYFDPEPYTLFSGAIETAGLKLEGLEILFDKQKLQVPALGNTWGFSHYLAKNKYFALAND